MVSKEQVEKILNEKLEDIQNGRLVGESRERALNLKVRAN